MVFDPFYYINIYKRSRKTIVLIMSIFIILAVIFSLSRPAVYISTVTLLSTEKAASVASLGRFLGIPSLSIEGSSNDIVISILKSRRMAEDISRQFGLDSKRARFIYNIYIRSITGGLAVDVKGSDPVLTEKIANFAIQNLDKINTELDITPNKPMVKVLDPATYGVQQPRGILKNMFVAGLLSFLLASSYVFFLDYIKKLRGTTDNVQ